MSESELIKFIYFLFRAKIIKQLQVCAVRVFNQIFNQDCNQDFKQTIIKHNNKY